MKRRCVHKAVPWSGAWTSPGDAGRGHTGTLGCSQQDPAQQPSAHLSIPLPHIPHAEKLSQTGPLLLLLHIYLGWFPQENICDICFIRKFWTFCFQHKLRTFIFSLETGGISPHEILGHFLVINLGQFLTRNSGQFPDRQFRHFPPRRKLAATVMLNCKLTNS